MNDTIEPKVKVELLCFREHVRVNEKKEYGDVKFWWCANCRMVGIRKSQITKHLYESPSKTGFKASPAIPEDYPT